MVVKKGQKIRYPKKRNHPVEHGVSGHFRKGRYIEPFMRGKGIRLQNLQSRSVVVGEAVTSPELDVGAKKYEFLFNYGDGEEEEYVVIISDNYADALDEAFEEKEDPRQPISYKTNDPDLLAPLKWGWRGIKGGASIGLQKLREAKTRALLQNAFSEDKIRRAAARYELKMHHRELYDLCSFSRG